MTTQNNKHSKYSELEKMIGEGIGRTRYDDDEPHYFAGMWVDHDGKSAIDLKPLAKKLTTYINKEKAKAVTELPNQLLQMNVSGVAMPRTELDKISIQDLRLALAQLSQDRSDSD